jgi:signal recognition particle subunit SRP54
MLDITGVILTKLDGDTRGGAALSVREVTGQPIKFSGTGEKLTDLEVFHPDRMASRILGMGDMLTLIEKAEKAFDEKKALELTAKIRKDEFTLDDFLDQFQQVKSMGSLDELVGMIPGMNASQLKGAQVDQKAVGRVEAIIRAMTPYERSKPEILNASRKRRIAKGSGTTVQEVNRLLNQFDQTRQMMKQLTGGRFKKGKKGKKGFFGF